MRFLVSCALGLLLAVPAAADEGLRKQLDEIQRALGARDTERRTAGLRHLASIVEKDTRACKRCLPKLKDVLRLRGPDERVLVMGLLPRLRNDEADRVWLERLDLAREDDGTVLAAAVAAVRARADEAAFVQRLVTAAMAPRCDPARKALLLEALGHMDHPGATLLLTTPAPDEHWVVAAGRALGLGKRRVPQNVPPLLDLLDHASWAPRIHAWESLWRITGRPFPPAAKPWRDWWNARTDKGAPIAKADPKTGKRYAPEKRHHVPHYYTIPIPRPGSRVVFCIDVSQSMYGLGIDQARRELTKTLLELPSTHQFEIVAFNERVLPWTGRLERAHPVQKLRAIRFLQKLETISYTNLFDAVETAFSHGGRGRDAILDAPPLDAVFLLSDGAPNRGRFRDEKRVIREIGRLSARQVPVHTIGAGDEVFPLLRAIARETGGKFVDAFE